MRSLVPIPTNGTQSASPRIATARRLPWGGDDLLERVLEDFRGAGQSMRIRADGAPLDVIELDDSIRISVEVPGIDPADLEVRLTGQVLTLAAEKRDAHAAEASYRTYSERRFGAFRRSIELPCAVDADQVTAEHRHGVVTVTLKKSDAVRPKRIEVRQA